MAIEEVTRYIVRCDTCERVLKRSGSGQFATFLTRESAHAAAQARGWTLFVPAGKYLCPDGRNH